LEGKELKEKILDMLDAMISSRLETYLQGDEWDYDGLIASINEIVKIEGLEAVKNLQKKEEIKESLIVTFKQAYDLREQEIGGEAMRDLERIVMLRVIDTKWIEQLDNMDNLRDGIGLRGYGGRDPLIEYKIEGYKMFQEMMAAVREEIVSLILRVQIVRGGEELLQKKKNITYGKEPPKAGKPAPIKHVAKVGRNDPCPCGSGKKYKKCCGKNE